MNKILKRIGFSILCITLLGMVNSTLTIQDAYAVSSHGKSITEKTVQITKLNDNVWVHTTYKDFDGIPYPSNGLIISTSEGLVLIDSSWDDKTTKRLLKVIDKRFNQDINMAIITHAHDDRIGGIRTLIKQGIDVHSTARTAFMAVQSGYLPPRPTLDTQPILHIGDTTLETYYPGEGHTKDNITIWLPQYKILFGGCLIKSLDAQSIGNVDDANIDEWPESIRKVMYKYSNAELVVPGHQSWGDQTLFSHTLKLIEQYHDQK